MRAILVGVDKHDVRSLWSVQDSLEELSQLAATAGIVAVASLTQRQRKPSPSHYIGRGKVQEALAMKSELAADLVIFDDELSPIQQRNLEADLAGPVLDRTGLILEIFAQRASTREGRLQVELARQEYLLPRLTRQWTHLSRQFGAFGARGGPGETQLESDRRTARRRIADLRVQLERVRTHRHLYQRRRAEAQLPVVALVGYTNAGKSTLLRALTGAEVLVENKLFATLDPMTRAVVLPHGGRVLLTDTVGFIQKLPPTVVAAFRATLEELQQADVLVHVVDITHPRGFEQGRAVLGVLDLLGLAEKPVVTALNKVDSLGPGGQVIGSGLHAAVCGAAEDEIADELDQMLANYPNGVAVSALNRLGLSELMRMIEDTLGEKMVELTVELPLHAGALRTLFHERGSVVSERSDEWTIVLTGRLPSALVSAFAGYVRGSVLN